MSMSVEMHRQAHLEVHGDADPHVEAALELRKRWLSVHSDLSPGGTLWLEKEGITTVAGGHVMIAWRPLDTERDPQDWEIVKHYLCNEEVDLLPERYDWLVATLSGDQVTVFPHALCLLTPYVLPTDAL